MGTSPSRPTVGRTTRNSTTTTTANNDDTISSTNSGNNNNDEAVQQQQDVTTDNGESSDILETANIMTNATSTSNSPSTNNNTSSNESSPNTNTSNNILPSKNTSSSKPSSTTTNSTTTRKLRTNRSQPKRYIAHPSKFGLTNDEMDDLAFLDNDSKKKNDRLASGDKRDGGGVKDDGGDKKMSAKKPSSAMKGKDKGSSSTKSSTNGKAKQSPSSSTTKPSSSSLEEEEEETNWSCHKCTTSNPISKSRCTNCKCWKDGVRMNYPTSLKKNSDSSSPIKKEMNGKGRSGMGAAASTSGTGAAAKSTSGKEGEDVSSTIGSGSGKKGRKKPAKASPSASSLKAASSATNTLEEGEDDNWTCHKCNNNNPSTRSRCTECLCWKGGTKEWKTTSTPTEVKKGGSGKKKEGSGKKEMGSGKQTAVKEKKSSEKKIGSTSDSAKKKEEAAKSNGSAKKKKSPSSSTKGSGEKKVGTLDTSATKKKQGAKIDETKKAPSATATSQKKRKRGSTTSSTADNNESSLPIAKRSKSTTTKQTTTTKQSTSSTTTSPSPRKKRTSCGTCTSCKRDDCGKCIACLDKVKFGGENKRKQKCFERRCINLVPSGGGSGKMSGSSTNGKGVNGKSSSKRRGDTKKSSSANQKSTTMGAAFTQRKSSMSRRPRQFKPTEKMLASMQEEDDDAIGELSSRKGNTKRKTDDTESDDDESNYDDVVCCLCKCAVDFSDKDFFLEPEESKTENGEMNVMDKSSNGLKSDEDIEKEKKEDDTSSSLVANDTTKSNGKKSESEEDDDDDKPAFQLPYKFHNPGNALILCDGPAHANGKRFDGSDEEYKCDRAYHQQCHFIPVLSIPRGPWRCLICRYRDEVYLKEKADRKSNNGQMKQEEEEENVALTDAELNAIFRCMPVHSSSEGGADDIASGMKAEQVASATMNDKNKPAADECIITNLEKKFEFITADLKSSTLHAELTTRSRSLIKSSLSTIRNAEHSLRTFTETSRARKALSERIQLAERERNYGDDDSDDGVGVELGLPQELCQCVMRIAVSKMRVREMIMGLENVIRSRPSHRGVGPSSSGVPGDGEWRDAVSDLMQWYQQSKQAEEILSLAINEDQSAVAAMNTTLSTTADSSKSLLHHLFPEGSLRRRRYEPRTGEAAQHTEEDTNDASSVTSISLDDLRCSSCLGTDACDDNDMLLCDGMGCYRSFHMQCLVPKVTLEDMQKDGVEDEDWFCPLCTAHANLIHFAQCEYFGDDPEDSNEEDMEEWEMARDVFSEAPFELRVAHKFKDNIFDDETTEFLAETMGIGGSSAAAHTGSETRERLDLLVEDDEEDDDFDNEEDDEDDESDLAEDNDMERRLLKEKIGKDELDALSITSGAASGSSDNENTGTSDDDEDSSDDEDNSDSGDGLSSDSNNPAPRRSKRRKFTLPDPEASGDDDDEGGNSDIGKLDVSNIVRGSRRRKAVDYRKLADVMFGDEEDEDAKGGLKKEYTPHEE